MVILYSNDCPRCKILKDKLERHGIEYTVSDNFDRLLELKIMSVPVLELDNGVILKYEDAVNYVDGVRGEYV